MRNQDRINPAERPSASRLHDRRKVDRRLDSWKEIGAFFGRDERTVKRWEATRGLPVRRLPGNGRASIYAFASELERWLDGTGDLVSETASESESSPEAEFLPEHIPDLDFQEEQIATAEPSTEEQISAEQETQSSSPAPAISPLEPPASEQSWQRLPRSRIFAAALLLAAVVLAIAAYRFRAGFDTSSRSVAKHAIDTDAQDFYLKGEYYLQKRTPESLNLALDNYTQAIVRDPSYAQAYAGLADCYNLLREYTAMPDSEAYPRALAAAKQAIALDDSLSRAHSALAFVDFFWLLDAASAEHEFDRAIALDPSSASAHHWYATCLLHLGRFSESLVQINRAQTLDPSSTSVLSDKGLILFYAGHPEQAITLLRQLETAEPGFLSPRNYLAGIYFGTGNYRGFLDEAVEAAHLRQNQDRTTVLQAAETGFHEAGLKGMLDAMFVEKYRLYEAHRLSAFEMASSCALISRQREALNYLRLSYSRHEPEIISIRIDLGVRLLSRDPEYRRLVAQMGFPPVSE